MLTSSDIRRPEGRPRVSHNFSKFKLCLEIVKQSPVPQPVGTIAAKLQVSWHGASSLLAELYENGYVDRIETSVGFFYFRKPSDNGPSVPAPGPVTPQTINLPSTGKSLKEGDP